MAVTFCVIFLLNEILVTRYDFSLYRKHDNFPQSTSWEIIYRRGKWQTEDERKGSGARRRIRQSFLIRFLRPLGALWRMKICATKAGSLMEVHFLFMRTYRSCQWQATLLLLWSRNLSNVERMDDAGVAMTLQTCDSFSSPSWNYNCLQLTSQHTNLITPDRVFRFDIELHNSLSLFFIEACVKFQVPFH